MMEFILSRMTLILCGLALMGTVAVPLADIFGDDSDDLLDELAARDAGLIDDYFAGGYESMYLVGETLLPSPGYGLLLDGHRVTLYDPDGNGHTAWISNESETVRISYGDVVEVCLDQGKMRIVDTENS